MKEEGKNKEIPGRTQEGVQKGKKDMSKNLGQRKKNGGKHLGINEEGIHYERE